MDDTRQTLAEITVRSQKSIISMLLSIQPYKILQEKSFESIESLDCLYVKSSRKRRHQESVDESAESEPRSQRELGRKQINGFEISEYVAVSYTWNPSSTEDERSGGYLVDSKSGHGNKISNVRDCVFVRILKYLESVNLTLFWLDQESINQTDKEEKDRAMHVMDLIYQGSQRSIALLSARIDSVDELEILLQVLRGELVEDCASPLKMRPGVAEEHSWKAVRLLKKITSDPWWTRAWTYQEEYKAGVKMRLLIPYVCSFENLNSKKDAEDLLGNTVGELCINSAKFREQATNLCQAYQGQTEEQKKARKFVLDRAGRYKVLLRETDHDGNHTFHKSMSPYIIADIGDRDLKDPWDRLPITSNCCCYPTRLDTKYLTEKRHSIGVSILALCLLNGEILDNNRKGPNEEILGQNVYNFLKQQAFDKYLSPIRQQLTYIKGCRFLDPHLTETGIVTTGYLWRLGAMLTQTDFRDPLPAERDARNGLERNTRRRLRQLAQVLQSRGYLFLAKKVDTFLSEDEESESNMPMSLAKWYQNLMAEEVVTAIEDGKSLRLGVLPQPGKSHSSYTGIFIGGEEDKWQEGVPAYIFTASREKRNNLKGLDIDRHVSLEVECPDSITDFESKKPRLYTKRGLNGLLFFNGIKRREVVFPWPAGLRDS